MKKLLSLAVIVLTALAALAAKPQFATTDIRDLCLIYQGATYRPDWTESDFEPYVTHQFPGETSRNWLFDGFLFLEFKDGKGRTYAPGYDTLNARRTEWEWYLDRLFERGKALDALDKTIGRAKAEIGDPGFRHKVVLTILVPIDGQKDWGQVDGKGLDFSKDEDKVAACRWFIDQLIERFNAQGYQNFDLDGFYWVAEGGTESNLPPFVAPIVHEKGYKFIWIPYWKSPGAGDWKQAGFDIAYQQPNHFFQAEIPDERLTEAVEFGRNHNMGMEMEFDGRIFTDPEVFAPRMHAYIDAYERGDVFKHSAIAYYEGGKIFNQLKNTPNPSPEAIRAINRLARHIVDRQKNRKLTKK